MTANLSREMATLVGAELVLSSKCSNAEIYFRLD